MEAIAGLFSFLMVVFLQALVVGIMAIGGTFLVYWRRHGAWSRFPKAAFYQACIVVFLVLFGLYFLLKAAQA